MEKKHMTLQDRQRIEQMLNDRKNFSEIALALDKFTANRAQFKLNKTVPPLSTRSIILMRSLFIRL